MDEWRSPNEPPAIDPDNEDDGATVELRYEDGMELPGFYLVEDGFCPSCVFVTDEEASRLAAPYINGDIELIGWRYVQ